MSSDSTSTTDKDYQYRVAELEEEIEEMEMRIDDAKREICKAEANDCTTAHAENDLNHHYGQYFYLLAELEELNSKNKK